jgi:hypothetical protein
LEDYLTTITFLVTTFPFDVPLTKYAPLGMFSTFTWLLLASVIGTVLTNRPNTLKLFAFLKPA